MKLNRRDFLRLAASCTGALTLSYGLGSFNSVFADESDPPLIWLQGAGCTGCTISSLNVTYPTTIDDILLNDTSMKFNSSIMANAGESALISLDNAATNYRNQFILIIEGAIPTGASGNYCILGEESGSNITMNAALLKYAPMAKYIVSAGTCASYGGIPAATGTSTACKSVKSALTGVTLLNPIVNLPSCPVHPTVLIQTLLDLVLTGLPALDSNGCPTKFYASSSSVHNSCPRNGTSNCYSSKGCQGTNSFFNMCFGDVSTGHTWNDSGKNCILTNTPCIGCVKSTFPTNPLYR